MKKMVLVLALSFLFGCATKHTPPEDKLASIQIVDRNGFKETISLLERLKQFEKTDFFAPQPYEKVLRMYGRNIYGKTISKVTTYHENGELWRYLEVVNGRACGTYQEWYDNGVLRLDVAVIEGLGDLAEGAQVGWIFDGLSKAWDIQGELLAEIYYEKGKLQGNAIYYHRSGEVSKIIPYENDRIEGELLEYDTQGKVIGKTPFAKGRQHGIASFIGNSLEPAYCAKYREGLLMEATYHDFSGKIIGRIEGGNGMKPVFIDGLLHSMQEYKRGIPEGEVRLFDQRRSLSSIYHIKEGMKHGEEWVYYPSFEENELQPKLYLEWYEDSLHGICRTWYPNGKLESEREVINNKKHGISSAWYKDGSLMLIEEYENDQLYRGTYRKRGDSVPVSTIENGEGVVTLYDPDGFFLKRVPYEKGEVVDEL